MFLFSFLNYWLYFLITAIIQQVFIPTAELAIPTKIPVKEAKLEIKA